MPLGVVGDIHSFVEQLYAVVEETVPYDNIPAVIQVGDFGLSPEQQKQMFKTGKVFAKPTYFIDGNHEYFDSLMSKTEVTEMLPNLFYCPRGTVLMLDGRIVAFMGGAASIDYKYQGSNWDCRENISESDVARLYENLEKMGNPQVDLFVCHVPPQRIIKKYFDAGGRGWRIRQAFAVGMNWEDPNATIIEQIWDKLGNPQMVCGHMHQHTIFDEKGSQVLGEFQFRTV
jgi:UDP-2,3-diacylglucosamine pyrophosphatase LpxH